MSALPLCIYANDDEESSNTAYSVSGMPFTAPTSATDMDPSSEGAGARILTVDEDVESQKPSVNLDSGTIDGSGDKGAEMSTAPTREEMDAKLETLTARLDTKIEKINGNMEKLAESVNHAVDLMVVSQKNTETAVQSMKGTTWAAAGIVSTLVVGLVAIIVAMFIAFPSFFQLGMSAAHPAAASAPVVQQSVPATSSLASKPQTSVHVTKSSASPAPAAQPAPAQKN